jgi:hypothetical protein
MERSKFLVILAPHFTAGVEVGDRAAPIIKYMAKWSEEKIREYCNKKGWKIIETEFLE